PTSGFEPAPRPCVSLAPSWIFIGAGEARRACMSVLATMNSTPVNSAFIMRLTALPPPPPSPITLIFAACGISSSSKSGRRVRSVIETSSFADRLRRARRVRERASAIIAPSANSGGCAERPPSLVAIPRPSRDPEGRDGSAGAPRALGGLGAISGRSPDPEGRDGSAGAPRTCGGLGAISGPPSLKNLTEPSGQSPADSRQEHAVGDVERRRADQLAVQAIDRQPDSG